MPRPPALPPDIKELMVLVRAGRLFEVQAWIKAGKRTVPPEPYSFSPLRVAIQSGFHSMVQVLLEAGVDQDEKNYMLQRAVWNRNLDLIKLLVDQGADPHCVSFEDACRTGNPLIMRMFIDLGVNPTEDNAFAKAFMNPNRPMLGVYKAYEKKIPSLKHQINIALRHHAQKGGLQWVCLLLWAGADAHVPLRDLDEDSSWPDDSTALEDAVRRNHEKIVEKIGIDPKRDNLQSLLRNACLAGNRNMMAKILADGAKPNGDGEDSPMEWLIWKLGREMDPIFGTYSSHNVHEALENVEFLAQHGARWTPTPSKINSFRRDFYKLDAIRIRKVLASFESKR